MAQRALNRAGYQTISAAADPARRRRRRLAIMDQVRDASTPGIASGRALGGAAGVGSAQLVRGQGSNAPLRRPPRSGPIDHDLTQEVRLAAQALSGNAPLRGTHAGSIGSRYQPELGAQLTSRVDRDAISQQQAQKTGQDRDRLRAAYGANWRNEVYGKDFNAGRVAEIRDVLADADADRDVKARLQTEYDGYMGMRKEALATLPEPTDPRRRELLVRRAARKVTRTYPVGRRSAVGGAQRAYRT